MDLERESRAKRPAVDASIAPIDQAIAYGSNAPSPHNTQAWKLRNLSDTETLLYVDETRLLPATDPPTRQVHLGCGCFIETLAVGASTMGYHTAVDDFPDGPYGLEEVGRKPVARIALTHQPGRPVDELAGFIHRRQTNRRPFDETPVSAEDLAELAKSVADQPVQFVSISDREPMNRLLAIFERAQVIECEVRRVFEETRIWFRFNERERAAKRDGLSLPQTGITGLRVPVLEWYLRRGDPKRWHNRRSIDAYLKEFRRGLASAQGLLLLKTATNIQADWIRAGRAYALLSLAAAKLGLYLHPYSQVLQEYPENEDLQGEFNRLLGVAGDEKVQMAVRVGRGSTPYYSYRRNVDSLRT
ncbi:Acg family FMN-binding oxidoreductase [Micromonospora sp. NPDC005806]|uniref:Acg family FMN-binding oxidoreductase n=1 Tax=Micromonospora sp. NPDC005806 TaxID=3364234 RepID=UPI00368656F8